MGDENSLLKPTNKLDLKTKLGYGAGGVLNVMAVTMINSYLLIYYHGVLHLSNQNAGIIMLVGKISGGVSTILIGIVSDLSMKNCWLYSRFGKRKTWHFTGTIFVLTFLPLFFPPLIHSGNKVIQNSKSVDEIAIVAYYSILSSLWGSGWAVIKTSHLALIPLIATCGDDRILLSAIRTITDTICNITLYSVALYLFHSGHDGKNTTGDDDLGGLSYLILIAAIAGGISSIAFFVLVKEPKTESTFEKMPHSVTEHEKVGNQATRPPLVRQNSKFVRMASRIDTERNEMECEVGDATINRPKQMKIFDWLSDYEFYMTASVFTASRLFLSLSQSYMPFYILYTLRLSSEYVAIIPLVTFVSGLIFSSCVSTLKKRIGLRATFCISCIIATVGCTWICFGCKNELSLVYETFGAAAIMGGGALTMSITSLGTIACFIGPNTEGSGFVYGMINFMDMATVALTVMVINNFMPETQTDVETRIDYFRWVLSGCCGGASLFILILVFFWPKKGIVGQLFDKK